MSDFEYTFPLEIETGDGVAIEIDAVLVGDYEPYRPAKISGPPENCYPSEGGIYPEYIDVNGVECHDEKTFRAAGAIDSYQTVIDSVIDDALEYLARYS